MSRRCRQLSTVLFIALLQLAGIVGIGAALKAAAAAPSSTGAGATVLAEEELDDVVADLFELPVFAPMALAARWELEHLPPAPVHLEREGRPPSA
ncbi:MAG: hypothetical protein IPJ65_40220 [Archangiaceae bacterium]|nr:hypothetical protein [Archangiaceae bacterium]